MSLKPSFCFDITASLFVGRPEEEIAAYHGLAYRLLSPDA